MDPWHQFWSQFFFQLSSILPYFAAGAAAVIAVSLTPFGRALTRYLRDGTRTSAANGLEETLAALRADSAEVLERLDFLERAIAQHQLPADAPRPVLPDASRRPGTPSGRVRTPV